MAVYAEQKPVPDCDSIVVYDQNDYWAGINIAFDTNTATIYLKGLDLNKVEPDFHSYFGNYKVLDYRNKQGFSVIQLTKPDYVNAYTPGYFGFHLIDRNDFDSAGLGTFTATCKPLTQPTSPTLPIWQVGPAMPTDPIFSFSFDGGTFGVNAHSGLKWNSGMFKDAPKGIEDAPIVSSSNIGDFVHKVGLGKAGAYGAYGTLEKPFHLMD